MRGSIVVRVGAATCGTGHDVVCGERVGLRAGSAQIQQTCSSVSSCARMRRWRAPRPRWGLLGLGSCSPSRVLGSPHPGQPRRGIFYVLVIEEPNTNLEGGWEVGHHWMVAGYGVSFADQLHALAH